MTKPKKAVKKVEIKLLITGVSTCLMCEKDITPDFKSDVMPTPPRGKEGRSLK